MTIVHILSSLTAGGAELLVCDLINRQVSQHRIHLIILSDIINPEMYSQISPQAKLHMLHRPPRSRSPKHLWEASRLLMRICPDVVHYHLPQNRLLFFYPARHIITVHGMTHSYSPACHLALARADCVVGVSRAVLDSLQSHYGLQRGEVIHNGIHTEKIVVRSKTSRPSSMKLVNTARLDTVDKAQDILLQALAEVRRLAPQLHLQLDFIGEGASRPQLEALTHQLGLQDSVQFVGNLAREEIYRRLADYDLMVHPSRAEGFGLAVAEGMVAALPLLAADCPALAEITQNGRHCALFHTDSVADCAAGIIRAATHPLMMQQRALAAREDALHRYGLDSMVQHYERIYRA